MTDHFVALRIAARLVAANARRRQSQWYGLCARSNGESRTESQLQRGRLTSRDATLTAIVRVGADLRRPGRIDHGATLPDLFRTVPTTLVLLSRSTARAMSFRFVMPSSITSRAAST